MILYRVTATRPSGSAFILDTNDRAEAMDLEYRLTKVGWIVTVLDNTK